MVAVSSSSGHLCGWPSVRCGTVCGLFRRTQLGHRLGLEHSYEEGESASPEEAQALMAWDTPVCECRTPARGI